MRVDELLDNDDGDEWATALVQATATSRAVSRPRIANPPAVIPRRKAHDDSVENAELVRTAFAAYAAKARQSR